ncbi:MFS transporter [Chengkuizengella axinellae]|uniref:MFS transporter n=1 Tax=Chengkuizengella axinellae TaxID=3064388 RepID=A0ABT9IZH3_9BACL|nr:MFS transporter [Chengkuizengella sp. 2205SS18-9]MDP5274771.1 MFS transporter [Chengkuizengella sp. 2205SS18-9]
MSKLWSKNFLLLSLSNFFMFGSFYMLLPTLPLFIVEVLKGNENQVGLIIGFFSMAQIFSRPLTGRWLDQFGRKGIFLIGRIVFVISMFFYLGISCIYILFLLRIIHGFGFGMATTSAGTIAADIIPQERRAEGMGYYSSFASLAMIVGPFVGMWLLSYTSYTNMFIVCTFIAAISVVLGYFIQFTENGKEKKPQKKEFHWDQLIEKKAIPISIVSSFIYVIYGGIVSFIALYAMKIGEAQWAGTFLGVFSLALILSRPVSGKMSDRYGAAYVVVPGLILMILSMVVLSFAGSLITFITAATLGGFSFGLIQPSLHALVIKEVEVQRRGAATATYFMSADIGISIGSFLLGYLASTIGYSFMYLTSCIFIIAGLIVYVRIEVKRRVTPHF